MLCFESEFDLWNLLTGNNLWSPLFITGITLKNLIFEYVDIWWPLNDLQTTSTLIYLCDITYSFFIVSTFLCRTIYGISNALSQQLLTWSDICQKTPCTFRKKTKKLKWHRRTADHGLCKSVTGYDCKYIIFQKFALLFWIAQFHVSCIFRLLAINTKAWSWM